MWSINQSEASIYLSCTDAGFQAARNILMLLLRIVTNFSKKKYGQIFLQKIQDVLCILSLSVYWYCARKIVQFFIHKIFAGLQTC